LLVFIVAAIQLPAQNPVKEISAVKPIVTDKEDVKIKNSCCTANPFTLTACTQSLFQSYKNLTAGVGVSNCHASLNYPTVSYAMPENCFAHQTTSASMVTYSSFYVPGIAEFRVI
jgi:hypothetical protein